ncbi:MAG: hypothetical protein ACC645_23315 [Pirellulales bacterium]
MTVVEQDKLAVIQLRWTDKDGTITVTPQDNDRFTVQLGKAIDVLQQASQHERFETQFKILLRELALWLKGRTNVDRAFISLRDGRLAFVIVKSGSECDESLEDELSDLDVRIANDVDLDLIELDVLSLPEISEISLSTFLDTRFVLQYADGK